MMTTNVQTRSATIHQFPARGRFAMTEARDESNKAHDLPRVACDGWYHDAAIEAERARKN
jgi:hypothetical protein